MVPSIFKGSFWGKKDKFFCKIDASVLHGSTHIPPPPSSDQNKWPLVGRPVARRVLRPKKDAYRGYRTNLPYITTPCYLYNRMQYPEFVSGSGNTLKA